ncbi:hypothetical protein D3C87_1749800 [compost metagenome]
MAHHRPNWVCDKCSQCPMAGNRNKAAALRMKTVPSATDICRSLAFITGERAAMALPPQMAVPAEISEVILKSIFNCLPIM